MSHAAATGARLGATNVLVLAFGWAFAAGLARNVAGPVFLATILLGMPPGVVAGTLIGWVAGRLDGARRLAAIVGLAVFAVAALGDGARPLFAVPGEDLVWPEWLIIGLSCVPTTICAIVLERATRHEPPLPPAIGRRTR